MSYDAAIISAGVSGAMVARAEPITSKSHLLKNAATWRWAAQQGQQRHCPRRLRRNARHHPQARSTLRALPQCPVCARHSMSRSSPSAHMSSLSRTRKLRLLKSQGREAKERVPGSEILDKEAIHRERANLSDECSTAPTAGIVCPYELTIATVENMMHRTASSSSAILMLAIEKNAQATLSASDAGEIEAEYVVNAAGVFCDKVASLIGDDSITIIPRSGQIYAHGQSSRRQGKAHDIPVSFKDGQGCSRHPDR